MKKSVVLVTVLVMLVSFVFAQQLQPDESTDVQVQVGNAAPIVNVISIDGQAVGGPIPSIILNPAGVYSVVLIVDVEDPNGAPGGNLDESTLTFSYSLDAGPDVVSGTISDCSSVDAGNIRTYTCSLNLNYYLPHGAWTADFSIDDTSTSPLTGSDAEAFNVEQLLDIDITSPINFGAVSAGQNDVVGITTTVTNNGNVIVPTDRDLFITAEELGSLSVGDTIPAGSFTAGGTNVASDVCFDTPGEGNRLVDATQTQIDTVVLLRGDGTGQNNEETLNYCLDVPNIAEESYSADVAFGGGGLWIIEIA